MKQLHVSYISLMTMEEVSEIITAVERHSLEHVLWNKPAQIPLVSFSILHNEHYIFLRFFVNEFERRATVQKTNGAVWEDSCVEFFLSFDKGESYFNFEFNPLGTKLGAFGTSKTKRKQLPVMVVDTITTNAEVINMGSGIFNWNLFVAIPLTVFQQPAGFSLLGKTCTGNVYKCGDGLQDPHFLSWSNIDTDEANFHLPEFFGEMVFSSLPDANFRALKGS